MKNSIVKKALAILSRIILLPVIAFGFILAGIDLLFDKLKEPSRKRTYANSHYYRDFQAPYHRGILLEDSYRFYNEAKDANLEFQMIHPSDNSPDYIISRGKAYFFPCTRISFTESFIMTLTTSGKRILTASPILWTKYGTSTRRMRKSQIRTCRVFYW